MCLLQLSAVASRRLSRPAEAQSKDAQHQQAALERRLIMAHAMLPEPSAGQQPGIGSETEIHIREELEEQVSVDPRPSASTEQRPDRGAEPDRVPGPGGASSGAAHLHMAPQQPDGWQPGQGLIHKSAASHSEPAAEGLDDGLNRLDAIIAAEEAGELQAAFRKPAGQSPGSVAFLKTQAIHWHSMACLHLNRDALRKSVEPRPYFSDLAPAAMLCYRLCRHGPLRAGSTTAPSKSPSKAPAPALRRGFLGPASRPDTNKAPAQQAVKQLPPAADEVQLLAQVREREAAAKPREPEASSATNSRRLSKFKQLRMVSEQ